MRSGISKGLSGLLLALIGAVAGAMLTTSYKDLRTNGGSYLPAVGSGFRSLAASLGSAVLQPWFYLPVAAMVIVYCTVKLTLRATKPRADPYRTMGLRMARYATAAQHDQRYRQFRSIYKDTIRICHEIEAFVVELQMLGVPVPSPRSHDAEEWIDVCCDYFTAVGPYLRNGNVSYAMSTAQGFAERYPPRVG